MITGSVVHWASASTGIIFIRAGLRLSPDWLLHLTEGGIRSWDSNSISHKLIFCRLHFSSGSVSVCWTSLLVNPTTTTNTHMHIHTNPPPLVFSAGREKAKSKTGGHCIDLLPLCVNHSVRACVCVCAWERERERERPCLQWLALSMLGSCCLQNNTVRPWGAGGRGEEGGLPQRSMVCVIMCVCNIVCV